MLWPYIHHLYTQLPQNIINVIINKSHTFNPNTKNVFIWYDHINVTDITKSGYT